MTEIEKQLIELNNKFDTLLSFVISNTAPILAIPPLQAECKYKLFDWLNEWYNIYKVPKLKPNSLVSIKNCIDKHIKQNIENKPLTDIKAIDIEKALNKIEFSRMKKYTYNVYTNAFKTAYKLDLVPNNVMDKVDSPTHVYTNGKALTLEQQQDFLKVIENNKLEYLYKFYILTGCRKAEALAVKWSDIDFNKNQIQINGTKTRTSKRILPLFDQLK